MGDFTTEQLYSCDRDTVALLIDAPDDDAAFAAMGDIHETASSQTEYRSYSYEQNVYLPLILESYAHLPDAMSLTGLNDYQQRPCIVFRTSAQGQAHALASLIDAIAQDPERLLPGLRKSMEQTLASSTKFQPAASDTSFMAGKMRETHALLAKSVTDFSITGDVVRQLLAMSPAGGFYPGDGPAKIAEIADIHAPRSNLVSALGHSFGFLKTLLPAYRDAEAQGMSVLHLQVYGT